MFVDVFIRRPILSSVLALVIILAGVIAIPTLPIAQYPELAPPQVTVSSFYTGASAQTVESAVTIPLEQAINGVEGLLYMTSSSTSSGVSQVTATFELSRNQDLAAVDVQNAIKLAEPQLPEEGRRNGITEGAHERKRSQWRARARRETSPPQSFSPNIVVESNSR